MSHTDGIYALAPGFDEAAARQMFQNVTDLQTLVIYCPDPRAYEIPGKIAEEFGLRWPGEIIRDETGHKAAFNTQLGLAITVGGRAVDALRTVTSLGHLLALRNVVVVHHTFCGLSAFTADGMIAAFGHEHGRDLAGVYDHDSLAIADYEASVRYDVALLRAAPGVHPGINLYGYIYDINAETLTRVIEDAGTDPAEHGAAT